MARNIRAPRLENRSGRLKLPIAKKPTYVKIDRGVALGYRRNQGAGTWIVRVTRDGADWTTRVGIADDYEEVAAGRVLNYWQAQAQAREIALGQYERDSSKPATVASALDAYETDLRARGANPHNAHMCRVHLPSSLAAKTVALLTAKELRTWRDGLLKHGLAPPSVTRICKVFKAALNLAAGHDPRITNVAAWKTGFAALPDAENQRNVILSELEVRALVKAAWGLDPEVGLLVECAAITGARVSQLARLDVGDLQFNGSGPKLTMPTSKKGRGAKRISRYPVPIPQSLANKLKSNRAPGEPLLRWRGGRLRFHNRPVADVVKRAGLERSVTIYALRHTSIVRQLLANVPIRVVAVNHDTSVVMIEKTYSKHIAAHSDEITRGVMLDLGAAP